MTHENLGPARDGRLYPSLSLFHTFHLTCSTVKGRKYDDNSNQISSLSTSAKVEASLPIISQWKYFRMKAFESGRSLSLAKKLYRRAGVRVRWRGEGAGLLAAMMPAVGTRLGINFGLIHPLISSILLLTPSNSTPKLKCGLKIPKDFFT